MKFDHKAVLRGGPLDGQLFYFDGKMELGDERSWSTPLSIDQVTEENDGYGPPAVYRLVQVEPELVMEYVP